MMRMIGKCVDDPVIEDRLINGGPIPFHGTQKALLRRLRLETWAALRRFFRNKKFHAGGPIPNSSLYTEQNFRRAISTPFTPGIKLCYRLFARSNILPPQGFDHTMIDWDIYFIINLLA